MAGRRVFFGLLAAMMTASAGCGYKEIFFEIPEQVAVRADTTPITWLAPRLENESPVSAQDTFLTFTKLQKALQKGFDTVGKPLPGDFSGDSLLKGGYRRAGRFLHICDTHIRDDNIYAESRYKDKLIELKRRAPSLPTIRPPHVYTFDSLVYASFLIACGEMQGKEEYDANATNDPNKPFVVDGGDLLDISLSTELVKGMNIRRRIAKEYEDLAVYSTGGNHDGQIWGNLPDKATNTRGLGINKTEFVLGHLLADRNSDRGFGFGGNEIIQEFGTETVVKEVKPKEMGIRLRSITWPKHICKVQQQYIRRQLDDIYDAAEERSRISGSAFSNDDRERLLRRPIAFRYAIHTSGEGDRIGPKCGYYSWSSESPDPTSKDRKGDILYIALDTRSNVYKEGAIDEIQLGWLYNELADAMRDHQCVVIFAHHHPHKVQWPCGALSANGKDFYEMLRRFPNIIAYFYGHEHQNEESYPYDKKAYQDGGRPENPKWHHFGNFMLIQTGSPVDFPQTAREVRIFLKERQPNSKEREVALTWRHVRPKATKKTREGYLLRSYLKASFRRAKNDYVDREEVEKFPNVKSWEAEYLKADGVELVAVVKLNRDEESLLDPGSFFGAGRRQRIDEMRAPLGLSVLGESHRERR